MGIRCFVEACTAGLPAVARGGLHRPPPPRLRRAAFARLRERRLVPVGGIEPPLLAEHDFESCASTSSATRACAAIYIRRPARRAKRKSGSGCSIWCPPEGPVLTRTPGLLPP